MEENQGDMTKTDTGAQVLAGHRAAVKSSITRETPTTELWFWTVGEREEVLSTFLIRMCLSVPT